MDQSKKPADQFCSDSEQTRLGCGPLSDNRNKQKDFTAKQKSDILARGNPKIDNNVIKGYN